jgi:ribosomal-protein-alanine N-acetyltransferase
MVGCSFGGLILSMLETKRLIIRPFVEEDFEMLCALRSDAEVMKYIGLEYMTPEKIADRLRFYIQSQKRHGFSLSAVILKETDEMIGWAGLQYLDSTDDVEVGYGFDKPYWGKGFATEAAAAWLRYGFEEAGLERIVAVAMPENRGSRHVMEKLGMRYEKNAFHYGYLLVYYAVTRHEFLNL